MDGSTRGWGVGRFVTDECVLGIACLQYRGDYIASGSSDEVRLLDGVECTALVALPYNRPFGYGMSITAIVACWKVCYCSLHCAPLL
jgi:hypothetical protein